MKKIFILMTIVCLFVFQLDVVVAATKKNSNDYNVNLDNEKYENYSSDKLSCGNGMVNDIPKIVPETVNVVYNFILVLVPVILVIIGMITLVKAVTSGKDDEIKKAQSSLIRKLISGALVFFVFIIVKLVISFSADSTVNIMDCANCFLNGPDKCTSKKVA